MCVLSTICDYNSKKKKKPKRKLKTQADLASSAGGSSKEDDGLKARKHVYRFGSRNLQVYKPTEGYPSSKDAKMKPQGKLELFYALSVFCFFFTYNSCFFL